MVRTGQAAADYARGRVGGTMPASGYCLQFVRQCFDVGAYYASALDAWNAARYKHPGDRAVPLAVPLYFATPSVYDHVVIGVGNGQIVTTFNADIRLYPSIEAIERDFAGTYLGWAEDINTVRIFNSGTDQGTDDAGVGPVGNEDDMRLIRVSQDGRIFLVTPTLFQLVPDMKTANALAALYGIWVDMDVTDADAIHMQVIANIEATYQNLAGQAGASS